MAKLISLRQGNRILVCAFPVKAVLGMFFALRFIPLAVYRQVIRRACGSRTQAG